MTEQRPQPLLALNHIALYVKELEQCERFYTELLGMHVDWRPDPDNVYLSTGKDNLALHRAPADFVPSPHQHLDHLGFALRSRNDVDQWHAFLASHHVTIKAKPKDHRDGTRSFYCADPDGNIVQFIYYP